ncbi:MAG: antibiotic biosynthesis monooxygenase [Bilophila sp.]|uniref:putative quinol monooxygenase n=1 Tax=uncultured Bilophila sp. TaxID=529385 RepID=UPI00266EF789|nr:putative quinol monooxygenase [uncultured Bilophila sp.]MBS6142360.1 antibiotic biosynthesis monooxygenase [Bilophila sp.]
MLLRHLMYSTALAALFAFTGLGTAHAADTTSVRIAHLQIKPEFLEAFTAAVKEEMEAALRVEPGVLAIYAVADKNDPTKLTFIEMYADEDAYQVHRDTPHFQKYFHTTKDMIAERVLLEAVPVELRDKHNTPAAD